MFNHNKEITIEYIPERHNGFENTTNDIHTYDVQVEAGFENRSNGEKFAGFRGVELKTGNYKSFRWDRVQRVIPIGAVTNPS